MKSKYRTISESEIYSDNFGNKYPDIFSFPIEKFEYTDPVQSYSLGIRDIYRFDLLIYSYYDTSDYTDIILWLNNIEHISDVETGTNISLPSKKDIENFYKENFV